MKFQKRTPDIATPMAQRDQIRQTPWGEMTYLDYRYRVEFEEAEYQKIAQHAADRGLHWFASPWDVPSVEFLENQGVPTHKVASASVTDHELLRALADTGKPIILSTGMSTIEQIDAAVDILGTDRLVMMHATSTYPLPPEEANLRTIHTLTERYQVPVGYSGHERGLQISLAAVALGAVTVERHITLDRTMWGSDQAASSNQPGSQTWFVTSGSSSRPWVTVKSASSPVSWHPVSVAPGGRLTMTTPLVSVILPAHNQEAFIADALSSLRFQGIDRDALEVVVIDDGSTDHTMDVVDSFSSWFPKLLTNSHPTPHGVSAARNRGTEMASGRYLAYLILMTGTDHCI